MSNCDAYQGVTGTPPAEEVTTTLTNEDQAKPTPCGTEYTPSVVVGVPKAADAQDPTTELHFEGHPLEAGFVWPSLDQTVSLTVVDSSVFTIGQYIYLVGFGYLKIADIPGSTIITTLNESYEYNPNPGTSVPKGTVFIVDGSPYPGIGDAELDAAIDARLEVKLPEAIDEEVESGPLFPNDTVLERSGGRKAVWIFDDALGERRLVWQTNQELGHGHVVVSSREWVSSDDEARQEGRLNPTATAEGDLGVFENLNPTDSAEIPVLKKLEPTDLSDSVGADVADFRLASFIGTGGSLLKKSWRALSKLVLPTTFVDLADLGTQDVEIVAIEKIDSDRSVKFRRIVPADGQALYGSGGKWVLGNPGSVMTPLSPTVIENGEYAGAEQGTGNDYVDTQLTFPGAPAGTTHAWIHVNLKYTATWDSNGNAGPSNAHGPLIRAVASAGSVCEASSMRDAADAGANSSTGFGSGTILVALDGSLEANFKVSKITAVANSPVNAQERVTWTVKTLGYVRPFGA